MTFPLRERRDFLSYPGRVGWIAVGVLLASLPLAAGVGMLAAGPVTDLAGHPLPRVRVEIAAPGDGDGLPASGHGDEGRRRRREGGREAGEELRRNRQAELDTFLLTPGRPTRPTDARRAFPASQDECTASSSSLVWGSQAPRPGTSRSLCTAS